MDVSQPNSSAKDRVRDAEADTQKAVADARSSVDTAVGEAKQVARERGDELKDHAEERKTDFASSLRTIATELDSSASSVEDEDGLAKRTLDRGAQYARSVAEAIEGRSLDDMLQTGKSFAKDNPAVFLGASIVAGFLASRAGKVATSRVNTHRSDANGTQAAGETEPAPFNTTSSVSANEPHGGHYAQ